MNPQRRHSLTLLLAGMAGARAQAQQGGPDRVRRGRAIVLPRDHGAHPDTRTEWWYATGWLGRPEAPSHGFQVTFFRSRTGLAQNLPGRLAPRQLLFAHAALTDLAAARHWHAQRLVRWNGETAATDPPRLAGAASDDARVWIGPWSLQRSGGVYRSKVADPGGAAAWSLELELQTTQPVLLQGDAGFSRKGPDESQASHYYSEPQMVAKARVAVGSSSSMAASGMAWLDHEWSDEILAADAVGWDWIGFNLFDGSALTAFRLRRADGTALWAGGSFRGPGQSSRAFAPDELQWSAGRRWRSPATGADYPMEWQVATPLGSWRVRSLLDSQELDSRQGTGTVYWEGLSELVDSTNRRVGLGYLEMTGYAGRLRM